jgi:hypothetical protein
MGVPKVNLSISSLLIKNRQTVKQLIQYKQLILTLKEYIAKY